MNIMNKVTWQAMWKNKTRTAVTIIGVMLSAALFMAVTTAVYSLWNYMVRAAAASRGDFYIEYDGATQADLDALRKDARVETVSDFQLLGYVGDGNGDPGTTCLFGAVDQQFLSSMPVRLSEGRLPENSSEIVLPEMIYWRWNMDESLSLGQTIKITVYDPAAQGTVVHQREYTVVGRHADVSLSINENSIPYSYAFTVADGGQGAPLSHMLFVKTRSPYTAKTMVKEGYGTGAYLHSELLEYYGIFNYSNIDDLIAAMGLILCAIIMMASVSLISNAFAISVTERTKQFALLTSVGATRKQIRKSARAEAWAVGFIGVPLGILLGYAGVAALMKWLEVPLIALVSYEKNAAVAVQTSVSWVSVGAAAVIGFSTVLLSMQVPAKRAVRITPIEAIRQNREYQVTAKSVKVWPLTEKLFGMEGVLGKKYYKVSRKKYRATVVSLTISMVIFATASQFSGGLSMLADSVDGENFDFSVYAEGEGREAVLEKIRTSPGVERTAFVFGRIVDTVIRKDQLDPRYLESISHKEGFADTPWLYQSVQIVYLEDQVLKEHLISEGIDPKPYLDSEHPVALRVPQRFTVEEEKDGETVSKTYLGSPVADEIQDWTVCSIDLPNELLPDATTCEMSATADGQFLTIVYDLIPAEHGLSTIDKSSKACYVMEVTEEKEGDLTVCNFYSYDTETQTRGQKVLASDTSFIQDFSLGACLKERPLGVMINGIADFTVVLPLSAAAGRFSENLIDLRIKASNYLQVRNTLENCKTGDVLMMYTDYAAAQQAFSALATIVRGAASGFLALIAAISAANVFQTISTNISLRRRDLAMLRSMGLSTGGLYRLLFFECMNYGLKALLWSTPISILMAYLCYKVLRMALYLEFSVPWADLAMVTGILLAVVFVTMLYGIEKIRKDNPIEAIRTETT